MLSIIREWCDDARWVKAITLAAVFISASALARVRQFRAFGARKCLEMNKSSSKVLTTFSISTAHSEDAVSFVTGERPVPFPVLIRHGF